VRACARRWLGLGIACAFAALVASVATAAADLRQIEAVGAVGVKKGERSDPRRAAIAQALREAVVRVANELLDDATLGAAAEERSDVDLDRALGKDMSAYASRFKVTEDRGLGPALFVEEPGITTEYVVVVEALVDATLVRSRLVAAGALEPSVGTAESGVVLLEVEGLFVHPALVDLRELLERRIGAASVLPREVEYGRTVLEVRTQLGGRALVEAMVREAPPQLTIIPYESEAARARIAVRWTPREPAAGEGEELAPSEPAAPNASRAGRR